MAMRCRPIERPILSVRRDGWGAGISSIRSSRDRGDGGSFSQHARRQHIATVKSLQQRIRHAAGAKSISHRLISLTRIGAPFLRQKNFPICLRKKLFLFLHRRQRLFFSPTRGLVFRRLPRRLLSGRDPMPGKSGRCGNQASRDSGSDLLDNAVQLV